MATSGGGRKKRGAMRPKGSVTLRSQADAHRSGRADALKARSSPNSSRPASEFRASRAATLRSVREQVIRGAASGRKNLKSVVSNLKAVASPGSAADRGIRYGTKLLGSSRLKPSRRS